MKKKLLPLGVVCLLASAVEGALVSTYANRTAWETAVSLPSVLTNVQGVAGRNWLDFSLNTYCPDNQGDGTCAPNTNIVNFTGNPSTMTFATEMPGTGLQFTGYASVGDPRLVLVGKNYDTGGGSNWQIGGSRVSWLETRNTTATQTSKLRITMPTGANSFAVEIALGCYYSSGCTNGENQPGMIALATSNGETATLGDTNSTKAFTNNTSIGEFTFFGFTSDQSQVAWIDLTPSSPGAIILARFTYATAITQAPPDPETVPEPATWATLASAAALLATRHYRNRR